MTKITIIRHAEAEGTSIGVFMVGSTAILLPLAELRYSV